MPRLVYFMYKGLKNAMSLVLYMRDFGYIFLTVGERFTDRYFNF